MKFDLIDSGDSLAGGVVEKFLEVFDGKIGYANILGFACCRQFLHFLPGEW